ncbi:MAG TPA: nicotinate-nucleotide adenylyltransferase [Syntrophales bacterium]|nr:nicotinate-nucleotide adenylyltransferase [Syntrophales bacterium]
MKWGIFGGTFDPVHTGHLRCAEEIRESFALDRIMFIPASRPPHKDGEAITPFPHRERMIRLAISGNPSFFFSDVENRREGMSYSVETVEHFLALHPGELEIYFILGQDAFQAIQTWKDWERFLSLCNVVVMTRAGCKNECLGDILPHDFAGRFTYDAALNGYQGPSGHVIFFRQVSFLDISSSDVRERIREGKTARYLVPDAVLSYIAEKGCYRR